MENHKIKQLESMAKGMLTVLADLKKEPVATPPLYEEAKEALITRIRRITKGMSMSLCASVTDEFAIQILGDTQYKHLKMEVVQEVVNKGWMPDIHNGRYDSVIIIRYIMRNGYDKPTSFLSRELPSKFEPWVKDEADAEIFVKLMQTELFEGDVTI